MNDTLTEFDRIIDNSNLTMTTLSPALHQEPDQLLLTLGTTTAPAWVECVLANFDDFLLDHAACEKKAAGMAISMISHYPDRIELVNAMAELAVEETMHYREVIKLIHARKRTLAHDAKDPYISQLRRMVRTGRNDFFCDRLLMAAVVEARGAERFALLGQQLLEPTYKTFYQALARSEARHYETFLRLACCYFPIELLQDRLNAWLEFEASLLKALAIRSALH